MEGHVTSITRRASDAAAEASTSGGQGRPWGCRSRRSLFFVYYIYIYIYTLCFLCICSFLFDLVNPCGAGRVGAAVFTADLRTKVMTFGGFDSCITFISRCGILMSIGIFPESLSQQILVGRILVGRLGVMFTAAAQVLSLPLAARKS